MLQNNKWITEKIKEEIKKYRQMTTKKTMTQNLQDVTKTSKREVLAIHSYLKKQEKSQTA